MCKTTSVTSKAIYTALNKKISQLLYTFEPWRNSTSVGADNFSTNIGIRNLLKTSIIACNDSIYFSGCPCNIIHNSVQKGSEAFACKSKFDFEDMRIDQYYWFDKSIK